MTKRELFPVDGLYKVLGSRQESCHGGSGRWVKNRWRSAEGPLSPCSNGIHLCLGKDLLRWLQAQIWFAEVKGDELEDAGDKVVVRHARIVRKTAWNERTARLFAADCAVRALERAKVPADAVVWGAVSASRQAAFGLIDDAAWSAAESAVAWSVAGSVAGSAAWSAAGSAAWSAARSAAWSAAESAAESAARSVAESAAESAAWIAGWSAARSAARSAAESAAGSAWSAAESAAWSAAESAARSAARSAEKDWQLARLFDYLNGAVDLGALKAACRK